MRDYKLYLYDIVRNLEVLGEASKHIPKRVKEKHSEIDWKAIMGMRNIIAHEYFGVRLEIVWKTVRNRLPELRDKIEEILKEGKK